MTSKILIISQCSHCKYMKFNQRLWQDICTYALGDSSEKVIENRFTIPNYCPLKDGEVKE